MQKKYAEKCENMDSLCKKIEKYATNMHIYAQICSSNMQKYARICRNICTNMHKICTNMQKNMQNNTEIWTVLAKI